ncbi:flagellar protein FlgN [Blastochloris sulfoviridis]|uniref:Flagellar protein FlgN n=1 Tax=Blastochloris sulfoviridis TaxID=50712 RepID=A0A5M6I429_9HYPH|nr:flagellar protein FlgN [Blastochloris sulfoviridis]KAA5602555.1 flagellar protein FlgN [Blastochloris sulfoviridis]
MMDNTPRMPGSQVFDKDAANIDASDIDAAVAEAIELIDRLVEVLTEENKILGRGFPASLIGSTARKSELGGAFEQWVAAVRTRHIDLTAADERLREAMVARSRVLNTAVGENVERLQAALDASHRRLDAVMRAIREDMTQNAPYDAKGQVRIAPAASPSLRAPLNV